MAGLFLSISMTLLFSMFFVSSLRIHGKSGYLLAVYIFSTANIILTTELAGLLHVLNQSWWYLLFQFAFLIVIFIFWIRAGRPALIGPFSYDHGRFKLKQIFSKPELLLLVIGIIAAYLVLAFLILKVPPNNNDSLRVHMSRVGYWFQHGSFESWPTFEIRQITYPFNTQLQFLWTVVFTKSDNFTGFVQWLAVVACTVAIFGISRLFGWSRSQSLFASLLFPTFPIVILQSTTTQNDLTVASLFVCSFFFLFDGIKHDRGLPIILSGLAMAMAVGTKQTIVFALPGMICLAVLLWIYERKSFHKWIFHWVLSGLIGFLFLGSFVYINNFFLYGTPVGPTSQLRSAFLAPSPIPLVEKTILSTLRMGYQVMDTNGIPDPYNFIFRAKYHLAEFFFNKLLKIDLESSRGVSGYASFDYHRPPNIQEDEAWFGPVSWLILLPSSIWQMIKGIKKRDTFRIGFGLILILFFIANAAIRPGWSVSQGRYMIMAVALASPFMAGVYQPRRFQRIFAFGIILLALIISAQITLENEAKPIIGARNIFNMSETRLRTLQTGYMRAPMSMMEKYLPDSTTIGIQIKKGNADFHFFGRHFQRIVIPIAPPYSIYDYPTLCSLGIQFLIIDTSSYAFYQIPLGFTQITEDNNWVLLKNRAR